MYIGKSEPTSTLATGHREGSSYYINLPTHLSDNNSNTSTITTSSNAYTTKTSTSLQDWHLRFNHLNINSILKLQQDNMVTGLNITPTSTNSHITCEGCLIGKGRRGTPPQESTTITHRPYELVAFDVVVLNKLPSHEGHRYVLIFLDHYSREATAFCLRSKHEVPHIVMKFDTHIFNRLGRHITYLRCDNAAEHKSNILSSYCQQHGIQQQFTVPYHSHQNFVERFHLTLFNGVRTMLAYSKMNLKYWNEAVACFTYTYNRSPTSNNDLITPYEKSHNAKPDVSHLQIFGSIAYVFIPEHERYKSESSKLCGRRAKHIFIGYSTDSKSYRLLNETGKVTIATHQDCEFPNTPTSMLLTNNVQLCPTTSEVTIHSINSDIPSTATSSENDSISDYLSTLDTHDQQDTEESNPMTIIDTATELSTNTETELSTNTETQLSTNSLNLPSSFVPIPDRPNVYHHPTEGVVEFVPINTPAPNDINAPPTRPRNERAKRIDYSSAFYTNTTSETPSTFQDIVNFPDKQEWYKAADAEMNQIMKQHTWSLVPPPSNRQPIKCKWVFTIKKDIDGKLIKYKARLCACGYSQMEGIDYKEIYSPVARIESLRFFLSLSIYFSNKIHKMDVTGAFLNGELEEEIYMQQPQGYTNKEHPDWVCKLHKNLYGLKQAPHVWHKTITPFLNSLGFNSIEADPCIFLKTDNDSRSIIYLHVDDILISASQDNSIQHIKQSLNNKFQMTDDGEAESILGIKIRHNHNKRSIHLSQEQAIIDILKDYNMLNCIPSSTPMEALTISTSDCPTIGSNEWHDMQRTPYRECVGKLTYLSRITRPDISFAVSVVNRFLHNPGHRHWNAVKRILRYLKGTLHYELTLTPLQASSSYYGYTDADWGGNADNAKSTSGYAFFLGNALISWSSKAQTTTATSSTYAEYIAAYHATLECLWGRCFLNGLQMLSPKSPTILFCDSQPTITLSKHHMITPRTKHFDTKYHYLREQVEKGSIELKHCSGKDNIADLFTKPLPKLRFSKLVEKLGLHPRSDYVKVIS